MNLETARQRCEKVEWDAWKDRVKWNLQMERIQLEKTRVPPSTVSWYEMLTMSLPGCNVCHRLQKT
jgi:hypothetical protein